MRLGRVCRIFRWAVGIFCCLAHPSSGAGPESEDFFERRIRPVLVEHCYECHSAQSQQLEGGLRLDTRDGLLAGGEGGDILQPELDRPPRLLRALKHDDLQMPPTGQLPARVIDDFAQWLEHGAVIPADDTTTAQQNSAARFDFAQARRHWAYQPIDRPALPSVQNRPWCRTPIDYFILAQLEAHQLRPSDEADPRTLMRRLYVDLTGLAPSADEVDQFAGYRQGPERDRAYEQLVDRLLASPAYGERWGRHWLDVARYADTKDLVLVFGDDRLRPYAYTYRDYVIRSLNDDLPYDEFVRQQLAADRMPELPPSSLAAMGFLTLGRLFDNNLPDIYDDQIDTVTRGLLGLTVSCARCHDHKYDAIPTDDYYSLYGMFANSETPVPLPLLQSTKQTAEQTEVVRQIEAKTAELHQHVAAQYDQLTRRAQERVADYLVRVTEKPDPLETAVFYLSLSPDDLRPQIVAHWRRYIQQRATRTDPVWGLWLDLIVTPTDADYRAASREVLDRWATVPPGTTPGTVNPILLGALRQAAVDSRAAAARVFGAQFLQAAQAVRDAGARTQPTSEPGQTSGAEAAPIDPAVRQLASELLSESSPVYFPQRYTYLYLARVEREQYEKMLQEIDRIAVASPHAPGRAMVVVDSPEPRPARVLLRGNPMTPGHVVPARFLSVLAGDNPNEFESGSGRLELARAITAPDNPLTARVMANRVWMHHLGAPLVATPSDFGTRSDPPSHPELLDYLAWTLQQHGWSLKHLHREIVLSAVYRQSSAEREDGRAVDAPNRWWWRANSRRLELEPMRDIMLQVAGRLDGQMYGRPAGVIDRPENRRRSLYGIVDRQELPGIYRVFDFASPDQSADQRPRTITPQQALFALNSPLVIACSQELVDRSRDLPASERATWLFRRVLSRHPAPDELQQVIEYIESAGAVGTVDERWRDVAQSLLVSNEFLFLD